jgi:outer membrane protein assembly factor BamC
MTTRLGTVLLTLAILVLAGCSSLESKKVDYKSKAKPTKPLEVPPDLSKPAGGERFSVPDAQGGQTLSEYLQGRPGQGQQVSGVLPKVEGATVVRAGSQRWLVVERPPEAVWAELREFWQEQGFIVAIDNPQVGVMETDWAENRAKIPESSLRSLLGKVIDQVYSTPERDKFRTRIERGAKEGSTEIYITHRGMYEVLEDPSLRTTGRTVWQPRPADPNLEAEMLTRVMLRFGVKQELAAAQVKNPKAEPRASVGKEPDGTPVLVMKDDFERAWRRVGLSLDRLGFQVQDRDRSKGLYYVKYLQETQTKKSTLSKLAFWESDSPSSKIADFRVLVADAQEGARVHVQSAEGKPEKSEVATRIINVLLEDLR